MKKIINTKLITLVLGLILLLTSCDLSITTFQVTYYDQDGQIIQTVTVNENSTVEELTAPNKDGYEFINWYQDDTFEQIFDFTKAITTNTSIYAKYEEVSSINYLKTENDLKNIKMDQDYVLANDITLTSTWTPLGSEANPFTGKLDGQNFTISNLIINISEVSLEITKDSDGLDDPCHFVGLFSFNNGEIVNLKLTDVEITGEVSECSKLFVGSLCGTNEGTISNVIVTDVNFNGGTKVTNGKVRMGALTGKNDGSITSCSTSGEITGYSLNHTIRIGGLVGANENGTISKSSSTVKVNGSSLDTEVQDKGKVCAGGLVGLVETGSVTSSNASGIVTVTTGLANCYGGGLIGYVDGGTITNSFATGSVTISSTTDGTTYGAGLIGYLDGQNFDVTVDKCNATGNVESTSTKNAYAGGLIARGELGDFNASISNCFAISDVTVNCKKKGYGGALMGISTIELTNCFYTTTSLEVTSDTITKTELGTLTTKENLLDEAWLKTQFN